MTSHGGYLMGAPMGITTEGNGSVRVKSAGFLPGGYNSPIDFGRMLGDWGVQDGQSPILAMSMGIDTFLIEHETDIDLDDGTGEHLDDAELLTVPGGGWLAFSFVLDTGVGGVFPAGGAPHQAIQDAASPQSTVFDYLLPESEVDPEPEGHVAVVGLTPENLGVADDEVIRGLDMHLALLDSGLTGDGSSFFTGLLPDLSNGLHLFFTLTPEFIAHLNAGGAWHGASQKLGTIYFSQFFAGAWSHPAEFHQVADDQEPIRGLALHTKAGVTEILFSSRGVTEEVRQIEAIRFGTGDPPTRRPVVIKGPGGVGRHSLGRGIGAGLGIGDFCTRDPYFDLPSTPPPTMPPPRGQKTMFLDEATVARRMRFCTGSTVPVLDLPRTDCFRIDPPPQLTHRLVPQTLEVDEESKRLKWGGSLKLVKEKLPPPSADRPTLRWPPTVVRIPALVPEIELPTVVRTLSVSGFRHHREYVDQQDETCHWPVMRACMNCRDWPAGTIGEVWVTFFLVDRLSSKAPGLCLPAFVRMAGFPRTTRRHYYGGPISVDCDFPEPSVLGTQARYFSETRAIAAVWGARHGATIYTGPASVLRLV